MQYLQIELLFLVGIEEAPESATQNLLRNGKVAAYRGVGDGSCRRKCVKFTFINLNSVFLNKLQLCYFFIFKSYWLWVFILVVAINRSPNSNDSCRISIWVI